MLLAPHRGFEPPPGFPVVRPRGCKLSAYRKQALQVSQTLPYQVTGTPGVNSRIFVPDVLKNAKPGLLLLHLVDLDSEQHDNAPFSRESNAQLEHLDSLLGQILAALPKGGRLALVSDHGFDRVDRITNPQAGAPNAVQTPGLVIAPDEATAALLRKQDGVGREVPLAEYASFPSNLPAKPAAVFEPSPGVMFGRNPARQRRSVTMAIGR